MTSNDFGRIFLTDQCQRIGMKRFLEETKQSLKKTLLEGNIKADDIAVKLTTSPTGNGGLRWWFVCPLCGKRRGILFRHPLTQVLGCRTCLNLKYRKSAKKGMIENHIF